MHPLNPSGPRTNRPSREVAGEVQGKTTHRGVDVTGIDKRRPAVKTPGSVVVDILRLSRGSPGPYMNVGYLKTWSASTMMLPSGNFTDVRM